MVQSTATDDGERQVLDDIAEHGWHCVNILEEEGQPPWAFTIGLFHTWNHPELIIFGLRGNVAHEILAIVARGLKEGRRIDLSLPTDDLLNNGSCLFVEVPQSQYREHVGYARWYYQWKAFPLFQVVWPSREGHFPWNPKAAESFRLWQPVLGQLREDA
jgi:hypothetical protein